MSSSDYTLGEFLQGNLHKTEIFNLPSLVCCGIYLYFRCLLATPFLSRPPKASFRIINGAFIPLKRNNSITELSQL